MPRSPNPEDHGLPEIKNIMPAPKMKPPKVEVTMRQLGDVAPTFEGLKCGRFQTTLRISAQMLPKLLAGTVTFEVLSADSEGGTKAVEEAKVIHVEHDHNWDMLNITLEHPELSSALTEGHKNPELSFMFREKDE